MKIIPNYMKARSSSNRAISQSNAWIPTVYSYIYKTTTVFMTVIPCCVVFICGITAGPWKYCATLNRSVAEKRFPTICLYSGVQPDHSWQHRFYQIFCYNLDFEDTGINTFYILHIYLLIYIVLWHPQGNDHINVLFLIYGLILLDLCMYGTISRTCV